MESKLVQADWSEICDGIKDEARITQREILTLSEETGMSELLLKHLNNLARREGNMIAHLNDYRKKNEEYRRLILVKDTNLERLEKLIERQTNNLVVAKGKENELIHFISNLDHNIKELTAKLTETETMMKLKEGENERIFRNLDKEVQMLRARNQQLEERESKTKILLSCKKPITVALASTKINLITGDFCRTSFSSEDLRVQSTSVRPNFLPVNSSQQISGSEATTSSASSSDIDKMYFKSSGAVDSSEPTYAAGEGSNPAWRSGVVRLKTDAVLKAERRSTLLRRFDQSVV